MSLEGEYEPSSWDFVAKQVETYESSGGTKGVNLQGTPCVIITMRGHRSGNIRKIAVMRVEHEGAYAAVASQGGAPVNPGWYYNLKANPEVRLQDGPDLYDMQARELTGDEKAVWWERATEVWPDYDEYQKRTDRQIPVFVLEP